MNIFEKISLTMDVNDTGKIWILNADNVTMTKQELLDLFTVILNDLVFGYVGNLMRQGRDELKEQIKQL